MIPLFNLFNDGMFKTGASLLKNFSSTSLSFGRLLLYGLPIEPTIRVIHIELDNGQSYSQCVSNSRLSKVH